MTHLSHLPQLTAPLSYSFYSLPFQYSAPYTFFIRFSLYFYLLNFFIHPPVTTFRFLCYPIHLFFPIFDIFFSLFLHSAPLSVFLRSLSSAILYFPFLTIRLSSLLDSFILSFSVSLLNSSIPFFSLFAIFYSPFTVFHFLH